MEEELQYNDYDHQQIANDILKVAMESIDQEDKINRIRDITIPIYTQYVKEGHSEYFNKDLAIPLSCADLFRWIFDVLDEEGDYLGYGFEGWEIANNYTEDEILEVLKLRRHCVLNYGCDDEVNDPYSEHGDIYWKFNVFNYFMYYVLFFTDQFSTEFLKKALDISYTKDFYSIYMAVGGLYSDGPDQDPDFVELYLKLGFIFDLEHHDCFHYCVYDMGICKNIERDALHKLDNGEIPTWGYDKYFMERFNEITDDTESILTRTTKDDIMSSHLWDLLVNKGIVPVPLKELDKDDPYEEQMQQMDKYLKKCIHIVNVWRKHLSL